MASRQLVLLSALAAVVVAIVVVKTVLVPQKRLNEPVRSQFYMACIGSGTPVTECMCLEKAAIVASGITHIRVDGDEATAQKFMESVQQSVPNCRQETLKEIAGDVDDAAQAIIDNTPNED